MIDFCKREHRKEVYSSIQEIVIALLKNWFTDRKIWKDRWYTLKEEQCKMKKVVWLSKMKNKKSPSSLVLEMQPVKKVILYITVQGTEYLAGLIGL